MGQSNEIKWVFIFKFDGKLHCGVATSTADIVATRKNIQQINPKMQIVDSFRGKPGLRPMRDHREPEEIRLQIIEDEPDHVPMTNDDLAVTEEQANDINAETFADVAHRE